MTTCVAAIVMDRSLPGGPRRHRIVTASDLRISFGSHSADNTVKSEPFHESWTVMIAGNDIAQCVPVIGRATKALKGNSGDFLSVRKTFKKAYQEQLREVLEDTLLSPFGMTLDEFKKKGPKQLPLREFESISYEIRRADLGCTFLVFGFDEHKRPHLFVVENPGQVRVYDKPGFWAIGSGAPSALAMLSYMGQAPEASSFEETVYNVLAAKYISESADGVGKQTFFFIHEHNSIAFAASPPIEPVIRGIWERDGKPKMPAIVSQTIRDANIRVWERTYPKEKEKTSEASSPIGPEQPPAQSGSAGQE